MSIVICPKCGRANPGSLPNCSECGESLIRVKRTADALGYPAGSTNTDQTSDTLPDDTDDTSDSLPDDTTDQEDIAPVYHYLHSSNRQKKKPGSRNSLVLWIGLFFLAILFASALFQFLGPVSRVIFIVGIMTGLAIAYFKINARSLEGNTEDKVGSVLMAIIIVPIGILFLLLYFAFDYVIDWLFSGQAGEKFVALAVGIVCGIVIEMTRDHLMRSVNLMRR